MRSHILTSRQKSHQHKRKKPVYLRAHCHCPIKVKRSVLVLSMDFCFCCVLDMHSFHQEVEFFGFEKIRRIRRFGLVGGSMSLGVGFKVSKVYASLPSPCPSDCG